MTFFLAQAAATGTTLPTPSTSPAPSPDLQTVMTFYNNAMATLTSYVVIWLTVLAIAVAVVAIFVTIVSPLWSRRRRKAFESDVNQKVKATIENFKEETAREKQAAEDAIKAMNAEMVSIRNQMEVIIAHALSGVFHVEGNMNLRTGDPRNAAASFVNACMESIKAKNLRALRVELKALIDECIPKLTKDWFVDRPEQNANFEKLLKSLQAMEGSDAFADQRIALSLGFRNAQDRDAVP